jgi:hypothetical protein
MTGPSAPAAVSVPCPGCGQTLSFPTAALHSAFQCPRCGRVNVPAEIVPVTTPLNAVPVEYPAASRVASATPVEPSPFAAVAAALADAPARNPFAAAAAALALPSPSPFAAAAAALAPVHPPAATDVPARSAFAAAAAAFAPPPSTAADAPSIPGAAPLPGAPPAAPGALTQALEFGVQGTLHVGRLGDALLRASDAVDRQLFGYRAKVVAIAASLAVLASAVEPQLEHPAPVLMAVATWLFMGLLVVLLLARLGSFRDDEGGWSAELVSRKFGEGITGWREALSDLGVLPGPARLHAAGRAMATLGIVVLAFRNLFTLATITVTELTPFQLAFDPSLDRTILHVGIGVAGLGVACRLLGWLTRPQGASKHLDRADQERVVAASNALPLVLDCAEPATVAEAAHLAGHPLLRQVLELLATWRPRRFDYEDQYEASLHGFIRLRLPWASPEKQYPLRMPEGGRALRADLVVNQCVLIEMKRGLDRSSAQRALGQVQMYHRAWGRGPVVLLLCDTDRATADRCIVPELRVLRNHIPVLLVLAARTTS